ncbi:MAG TPA: transcriptional regulator [Polyangia bacterium]
MRGFAAPKVYRSFEEFERDELRKLDGVHVSIDDMLDEMFAGELDFDRDAKSNREDDDE